MEDFKTVQQNFTRAIRDPQKMSISDREAQRRINIYQALFFNNINQFLCNGFPVLHQTLSEKQWQALARDFFILHPAASPYFCNISKEFIDFLAQNPPVLERLPAWVSELAHYEWLELDLSIRQDDISAKVWTKEDLPLQFCCSALASLVSYQYEVHRIGPDYQPARGEGQVYYYVVYRNAAHEVKFLQVNEVTAFLIQNVDDKQSFNELLVRMKAALPQLDETNITTALTQTLQQLLGHQIFLKA